jgi:hypothetical protein
LETSPEGRPCLWFCDTCVPTTHTEQRGAKETTLSTGFAVDTATA